MENDNSSMEVVNNTDNKRHKFKNGEVKIEFPDTPFTIKDIIEKYPNYPQPTIRLRVQQARESGEIDALGTKHKVFGRPILMLTKLPISKNLVEHLEGIDFFTKYSSVFNKEISFNRGTPITSTAVKVKVNELMNQ